MSDDDPTVWQTSEPGQTRIIGIFLAGDYFPMDTTAKIQPALTAEEWAAKAASDACVSYTICGTCGARAPKGETLKHCCGAPDFVPSNEAHRNTAIWNAALPDDDPRKITRADLATLDNAWDLLDGETWDDSARAVAALRAKLAALLPPEASLLKHQ